MKLLVRGFLAVVYAWSLIGIIALWVELPPHSTGPLVANILGTIIVGAVLAAPPIMIWDARRTRRKNDQ